MDFCPAVCAAPFTVHCEKVYPAGSVAGACRFTLVADAMPEPCSSSSRRRPVLEPMLSPVGGVDCTVSV